MSMSNAKILEWWGGAIMYSDAAVLTRDIPKILLQLQPSLPGSNLQAQIIPYVVMASFSIELSLKFILLAGGKDEKTLKKVSHNTEGLFKSLPPDLQDSIKQATLESMRKESSAYSEKEFSDDLSAQKDCFKEWRYFMQGENKSCNIKFLEAFKSACMKIGVIKKNELDATNS